MIQVPARRRRLRLPVATVLAVTLGAGALAVPATAVPATAAPAPGSPYAAAGAAAAQTLVAYPGQGTLGAAGRTGFLTWTGDGSGIQETWTRYSDGSTTSFTGEITSYPSYASDSIALYGPRAVEIRDMATGRTVNHADLSSGLRWAGAVGSTLLLRDGAGISLRDTVDGVASTRPVTGLPAVTGQAMAVAGTAKHALLRFQTLSGSRLVWNWALIDLATATVTEKRQVVAPESWDGSLAVSATHVAWVETSPGGVPSVTVAERGTGKTRRFPLTTAENISVGLVGDWVTYAQRDGLTAFHPDPLYALTAHSLTSTATRKVIDHLTSSAVAPDGALLARGGTAAGGEGLYRIAPGTDGIPVATKVATTGEPTKVTLLGSSVPATVSPRVGDGLIPLKWTLSRTNVALTVTLRHTKTGATKKQVVYPTYDDDPHVVTFDWKGDVAWNGDLDMASGAPNGAYTWQIDAKPVNGIGPDLRASGSFTLTRRPALHDYDSNGTPDVVSRDTTGRLRLHEVVPSLWFDATYRLSGRLVGSGWQVYDTIEAAGDLGGSAVSDLVARDRSGVLWLYKGRGDSTFTPRTRIGGGWNTYNRLTGGSDLTGDGRADLLATDAAGGLWLYKGTGVDTAPFSARRKIGTGWGTYNQITAVGNIAGGPAGDLVARDRDGALWLHLGRGDGTFTARTKIGTGWGGYGELVGVGDADRDGRPDLYATGPGDTAYLYGGTGSWSSPFRPREKVDVLGEGTVSFNHFA